MNIIPWNRLKQVDVHRDNSKFNSLQNEINRLFEDFFGDFNAQNTSSQQLIASPAIDIIENENGYKISAELPAMDSKDVDISINENYLVIKGEKKEEKDETNKENTFVSRERYYGSYQRTIALPQNADTEKAEAIFKKGVLNINIPKKAEAKSKSRKIEVKS